MTSTNDLRFDEQVAVVTGAGGGLGKQYALLLASRGGPIVVNDIGGSVTGNGANVEAARAVAEEIGERGGEAVADGHSVTTAEGGQAIIDTACAPGDEWTSWSTMQELSAMRRSRTSPPIGSIPSWMCT